MPIFKRNISTYTDEELLEQYNRSRDSEYFGILFNRYVPLLYGICLKYLKNKEKAEDAVMQLFEDLLPKISNYEIRTFKTWLYSVAKNHCFQLLRKSEKEVLVDFNVQFVDFADLIHLLSNEKENEDERLFKLNQCLEKLPEVQRNSINKFFMEEMSYADIVEATGYQMKSVKSYIQNGKRNLKICIENMN